MLKRSFLVLLLLAGIAALAFLLFPPPPREMPEAALWRSDSLASVLPGVVIALTNTDRVKNGSLLLAENPLLTKAAQMKADDMLARHYYSHTTPEGNTPLYFLDLVGYTYLNVGENLDLTYVSTADDVETAWMNSPAHRANLLLPQFTEIGVGVAEGEYQGEHVTFVAEILATPLPPPAPAPAPVPVAIPKAPVTPHKTPAAFTPVIPVSSPVSVQTASETFISTSTEALPPVLEKVLTKAASTSSSTPKLVLSAPSTASAVELMEIFKGENRSQGSLQSFISAFRRATAELFLRIYYGASYRERGILSK